MWDLKKRRSQATFPYDTPIIFPNVYIQNSLLNSKKFVFPAFEFSDFNIQCPDQTGRYTEDIRIWYKLAKLSEESSKGIIPSITPGRNKQTALLPLSIFDKTTVTVSTCYFLHMALLWVDLKIIFTNGRQLQIPNSSFTKIN